MTDSPAAWHPDPTGRFQLRFWDGRTWTEHVSTDSNRCPTGCGRPSVRRAVQRAGARGEPKGQVGGDRGRRRSSAAAPHPPGQGVQVDHRRGQA
ncbi:MAG: DUF2510 domain-containing protein [Acidimicrobiales bacterium]